MLELLVGFGLALNAGFLAWVGRELIAVRILVTRYESELSIVKGRLGNLELEIINLIKRKARYA